jgi:hypothetical protein
MMQYLRRSIDPRDQYHCWIDPRHSSLRLEDVVAYLLRRGWKRLPPDSGLRTPDRPGLQAFQEPGGESVNGKPLCQFVPDSDEYDNHAMLMFELITGLAEYEDRQASEVIDDILRPAGRDASAGTIPQHTREAEVANR